MVHHKYDTRYKSENNYNENDFAKLLYEKFPSNYTLNKLKSNNANNKRKIKNKIKINIKNKPDLQNKTILKQYYFNKLKRNCTSPVECNEKKKLKSKDILDEENKIFNIYLRNKYEDKINEIAKDETEEDESEEDESEGDESEEDESEEDETERDESEEDESEEDESERDESEEEFIYNKKNIINKEDKNIVNKEDKNLLNKYKNILKNKNNNIEYFKNLNTEEKKELINKITYLNSKADISIPYEVHLLNLNIEEKYKIAVFNKVKSLNNLSQDTSSTEYIKLKNWIEMFTKIPFNNYSKLPVTINDGFDKCKEFILESRRILDQSTYGLNDAKMQIMQFIAQIINNPNSNGIVIGIKGPMGTGKTTLVKDGISKILNRPFVFLPLAGIQDGSYLDGHSYTYEGSKYGKIVDILIQSKTMNPIIYGDELDKVSGTPKGDEIIGLLTHLTDTTQASEFNDKYFSEINFNLNKIVYIFSYNDDNAINPILRDRMYKIETNGYSIEDKIIISKKYLIPKIIEEINADIEIEITDDAIKYIINNFTDGEKGVRNLKRCLETIYKKLNLYKYVCDDEEFKKNYFKNIDYTFPLKIDNLVATKLLQNMVKKNDIPFGMYN